MLFFIAVPKIFLSFFLIKEGMSRDTGEFHAEVEGNEVDLVDGDGFQGEAYGTLYFGDRCVPIVGRNPERSRTYADFQQLRKRNFSVFFSFNIRHEGKITNVLYELMASDVATEELRRRLVEEKKFALKQLTAAAVEANSALKEDLKDRFQVYVEASKAKASKLAAEVRQSCVAHDNDFLSMFDLDDASFENEVAEVRAKRMREN